VTQATPISR